MAAEMKDMAAETTTPAPPNTFRSEEELKRMLQAGLDSGPAVTMISSDWESTRQEVHARRAAAKNAVCKGTCDDSKSAP